MNTDHRMASAASLHAVRKIITKISLKSLNEINVPAKDLLAVERESSFVLISGWHI